MSTANISENRRASLQRRVRMVLWVMLAATIVFTIATSLVDPDSHHRAHSPAYRWIQRKVAYWFGNRTVGSAAAGACMNNLRQIDGAKQQWALENHCQPSDVPTFSDIAPYLGRSTAQVVRMKCPRGDALDNFFSSYTIGAVTNPPTCRLMPTNAGHVAY